MIIFSSESDCVYNYPQQLWHFNSILWCKLSVLVYLAQRWRFPFPSVRRTDSRAKSSQNRRPSVCYYSQEAWDSTNTSNMGCAGIAEWRPLQNISGNSRNIYLCLFAECLMSKRIFAVWIQQKYIKCPFSEENTYIKVITSNCACN